MDGLALKFRTKGESTADTAVAHQTRRLVRLDETTFAGDSYRRGWNWAPFEFFGHEVFLGVQGLVPGDALASVGGHSAHDGEQRRLGHALAVVDGFAFADGGEHFIVLGLVHVVFHAVPAPGVFAFDLVAVAAVDGASAFGAVKIVEHAAFGAFLLAAREKAAGAVGVVVDDGKVIVDVAIGGVGALLAAAGA